MAAPESTKLQVNFKSPDGTLINLYASSKEELESLLTAAQDFSALIGSVSQSFGGAAAPAPVQRSGHPIGKGSAPVEVASSATEVVTDKYGNVWTYGLPDAPDCLRGKMVLKQGLSKQGKPYKGWFDPAAGPKWSGGPVPKDGQAATIWA